MIRSAGKGEMGNRPGEEAHTPMSREEGPVKKRPEFYPAEPQYRLKWFDPANSERWVAVLVMGDKVRFAIKKGF